MKSIEIFSGMGGLAKGLELAGFSHDAFVEFNKDACNSLRLNFEPKIVFHGDIRNYDFNMLENIDVVAGGPPCQPFSLGGKHKASSDSRDMFPYAISTIETLKPKAFIFENVKGLLRQSFAAYFEYIILRLSFPDFKVDESQSWEENLSNLKHLSAMSYSGTRYKVKFKLINAADYGVPQTRERVVIIGIRSDLNIEWEFPKPTHSEDSLLWAQLVTGHYWKQHNLGIPSLSHIDIIKAKALQRRFGIFTPELKPWQTVRDTLQGIPDPQGSHDIVDHIYKSGAKSYAGHTGSYIDWPSKTIKAGGHGVPGGENMIRFEDDSVRYLTVYEAKLIQAFPKDFIVTGAWGEAMRQIGNAVPVLLAQTIGEHLSRLLKQHAISASNVMPSNNNMRKAS